MVVCLNLCINPVVYLLCAQKGQLFHSPGQRPGYRLFMRMRPVRAAVIIPRFYSCPYRAHVRFLYPFTQGVCPELWKPLGFQPVLACPFTFRLCMPICNPYLPFTQPFIFSTTSSSAGSHLTELSSSRVSHLAASCSRRVRLPLFTLQM